MLKPSRTFTKMAATALDLTWLLPSTRPSASTNSASHEGALNAVAETAGKGNCYRE